jgi:hypothetical protein
MINRNLIALAIVAACIAVAGCSNRKDASAENLSKAIASELEGSGPQCYRIGDLPAEYSVAKMKALEGVPGGPAGLEALARAGVLSETDTTVKVGKPPGAINVPGKRFEWTEAGKKSVSDQGLLCFGKLALDKVVSWTPPTSTAGAAETIVTYQYRLEGMPEWAKNPDIQTAYPDIARLVNGAGRTAQRMPLVLTEDGWISEK